jgi:ribose-phosphate pyrophosphokinase
MLFAGTSHSKLAFDIAKRLKWSVGKIAIKTFPDGETGIEILENVRGKEVFVLQTIAKAPNQFLVELLLIVDALKRASAKTITAIIPYFGYARQDRRDKREPISAKLIADMLQKAGVGHVLTMDFHAEQLVGFFDIPVDNLYARPLFVDVIEKMKLKNVVVVSPDVGSNKMARRFAEDFKADIAIIDKRRISADKVEAKAIIGDVKNKTVLLVDDICSTGKTLETASSLCKEAGAKGVIVAVTHGVFVNKVNLKNIDKFLVTDTIPIATGDVDVISSAPLFSEAINCLLEGTSISSLYQK